MADSPLASIAEGITWTDGNYWRAPAAGVVSYPEEAHDRWAELADASFWFRHRNRVIVSAVQRFPPLDGMVADIGGGTGYVAASLQAAGFEPVVIEPSESGARHAVRRGVAHVICGSPQSAGLKPSSIGGAGMFDVLEHIEDDEGFLRYLRSRMKEQARLYVTVPAFQRLWSDADVRAGHFRRYQRADLTSVVRRAGFVVEYCTYFFWCLPPMAWAVRVAGRHRTTQRERSAKLVEAEHAVSRPLLASMVGATLAPELALIRAARRIPFGTSALLVARASDG